MSETQACDVEADINYFPAATTTAGDVIETKDWEPRLLGDADEHTRKLTIHDVRGIEDRFELDRNGFQFVELPTKARDVTTDEKIQDEYYPEVAEVLQELYAEPSERSFTIPHLTGTNPLPVFSI